MQSEKAATLSQIIGHGLITVLKMLILDVLQSESSDGF